MLRPMVDSFLHDSNHYIRTTTTSELFLRPSMRLTSLQSIAVNGSVEPRTAAMLHTVFAACSL